MNAYDGLLVAIQNDPDLPEQAKRISCALVLAISDMSTDIKRIANALEKRPPTPPEKFERGQPWIKWNGQDRGPWKNLDPRSTVRVQFRSKPDHIETYRLDSSEIDWSDVIAYQIVNRSE